MFIVSVDTHGFRHNMSSLINQENGQLLGAYRVKYQLYKPQHSGRILQYYNSVSHNSTEDGRVYCIHNIL
uniref:Uncharacterized protein n=1 Tax=Anguilla anguilla TaxID=7936 RepID=A0A0E9V6F0_ANGAN